MDLPTMDLLTIMADRAARCELTAPAADLANAFTELRAAAENAWRLMDRERKHAEAFADTMNTGRA